MAEAGYRWPGPEVIGTASGHRFEVQRVLVQTVGMLEAMRQELVQAKLISYDTETSGLHVSLGARVIGHAFATQISSMQIKTWYVPIRHIGGENEDQPQLPIDLVSAVVAEILGADGMCVLCHAKFDWAQARADGISFKREFHDIITLATAANENLPSYSLKNLAFRYCNAEAKNEQKALDDWMRQDARKLGIPYSKRRKETDDGLLGEAMYKERFGYARTPLVLCGIYACKDVFYTLYLFIVTYNAVPQEWPLLVQRENRVTQILYGMEWNGVPVDVPLIRDTHDRCKDEYEHWLSEARSQTGNAGFTGSDNELRELFFDKLGMVSQKKTKKDQNSVDREARLLLAARYPQHEELLGVLGRLARSAKLHTTYTGNFLRYVSNEDKIHASYNQLEKKDKGGAPVTGRLSSAEPNIQNIDNKPMQLLDGSLVEIRRYFVVPEKHIRFYIDFSQIELRMLTWYCQDPVLLQCYQDGLDVHQIIADQLDITRSIAKQVNFGNSYGMTEIGLALRLPGYYKDPEGTRVFAKRVLDGYFARYANIRRFRDQAAEAMRQNHNLFVSPFARPRRIEEISSGFRWERERGMRKMMSSIVSGTAADLMKESMIRCDDILLASPLEARMVQTIHDELVFDVPVEPGWVQLLIQFVRAMEDWPMFSDPADREGVPIKVSVDLSTTTWADKKAVEITFDDMIRFAA